MQLAQTFPGPHGHSSQHPGLPGPQAPTALPSPAQLSSTLAGFHPSFPLGGGTVSSPASPWALQLVSLLMPLSLSPAPDDASRTGPGLPPGGPLAGLCRPLGEDLGGSYWDQSCGSWERLPSSSGHTPIPSSCPSCPGRKPS